MLTRDRTAASADAHSAMHAHVHEKNAAALPVARWYRMRALSALQPYEQAEVVREAERQVKLSGRFWTIQVGWLVGLAVAWYLLYRIVPVFAVVAPLLAVFGTSFVHVPFVRREISAELARRAMHGTGVLSATSGH
jgi:anti-sigma factor RsiW